MKRALIVVDVQNEYFTGNLPIAYPPREESLAAILAAMDTAREHGVPVVVVRHTAPAGSPIFAGGGHGWELREEVAGRPYDLLTDKSMASAFAGTGLGGWLDARGIDTVAVAGYMTQNCDESTARDAYHRGLRVEFLSDATGTVALSNRAGRLTAEEVHRNVLVVMDSNFASVATTAEWTAAVAAGEPLPRPDIWASTRQEPVAARG
ncbi:cysteine hydrolase family protein [Planomonospora venezuelensis]|uniref:Nicotinamidase-related amidase n=1 Tax=Planomonospora venezuelensis TaxID=1999 RepID=A0A841D0N5_PLAVE|nr:cysteine hydrolase family protein [Planomonospora venezuelensis]MBB5963069.1 nicotinamidase-related amidase [Planomonospora venezuelensis]GIN00636.1 cysteine hydrolase [Planomonospora venezuelensis]